jgi:hypothetical protein
VPLWRDKTNIDKTGEQAITADDFRRTQLFFG